MEIEAHVGHLHQGIPLEGGLEEVGAPAACLCPAYEPLPGAKEASAAEAVGVAHHLVVEGVGQGHGQGFIIGLEGIRKGTEGGQLGCGGGHIEVGVGREGEAPEALHLGQKITRFNQEAGHGGETWGVELCSLLPSSRLGQGRASLRCPRLQTVAMTTGRSGMGPSLIHGPSPHQAAVWIRSLPQAVVRQAEHQVEADLDAASRQWPLHAAHRVVGLPQRPDQSHQPGVQPTHQHPGLEGLSD